MHSFCLVKTDSGMLSFQKDDCSVLANIMENVVSCFTFIAA